VGQANESTGVSQMEVARKNKLDEATRDIPNKKTHNAVSNGATVAKFSSCRGTVPESSFSFNSLRIDERSSGAAARLKGSLSKGLERLKIT